MYIFGLVVRHRSLRIIVAVVLVAVLTGCNLFGPKEIFETASVNVAVSADEPVFAIVGGADPANIDLVVLTVSGQDKYGVFQNPLATAILTPVGGVWQVTVDDLPIGPPLTFTVQAFDSGGVEIYSGASTRVLGGVGETVALVLHPVDDGTPVFFPVIQQITRPAEILHDTDETVSVELSGTANEDLDLSFASGGGSFVPNPTVVSLPSSGAGSLDATYSAPSTVGTYVHSVRVENSQGNSVEREFTTTVVYETGDAEITIGIAPAVIALSATRLGDDLSYAATVTDDGPIGLVTYSWVFTQTAGSPGAAFANPTSNPASISIYDESVSGSVELTVTDGDGLSSTVTFGLPAGFFPDDVVSEPTGDPTFTHHSVIDGYPVPRYHNNVVAADGGIILMVGAAIDMSVDSAATWMTIPGPVAGYSDATISRDGSVLAALVRQEGLYLSTDTGASWTLSMPAAGHNLISPSLSSDGSTIAFGDWDGPVTYSTDGGTTWATAGTSGGWNKIAVSDDGLTIAAVTYQGALLLGTGGGASWVETTPASSARSLAVSADGSILVIGSGNFGEPIYVSADAGLTWSAAAGSSVGYWLDMDMSLDGREVYANSGTGPVHVSADGGNTFSPAGGSDPNGYDQLAVAPDSNRLYAAHSGGYMYHSDDLGMTFSRTNAPAGERNWRSIGASSDLGLIIASGYASGGEFVFKSVDAGETWSRLDSLGVRNRNSISVSGDGSVALLLNGGYGATLGEVLMSTDMGVTWSAVGSVGQANWGTSAINGDGSVMVISEQNAPPMISTDTGQSWTSLPLPSSYYVDADVSEDGSVVVLLEWSSRQAHVSTDGGVSWVTTSSTPYWDHVAISGDGSVIYVGTSGSNTDPLSVSHDGGVSWSQLPTGSFRIGAIATDYSGDTIISGGFGFANNRSLTSVDGGSTWVDLLVPAEINYDGGLMAADGSRMILVSGRVHIWDVTY